MQNVLPVDTGNAMTIATKTNLKTNIFMDRFESMFDFFSDEPFQILAKEKEDDPEDCYERILQIRIWNRTSKSFSWSLYSRERQEFSNFIIRKVVWDMDMDIKFLKGSHRENREKLLKSIPSISIQNKFITLDQSNQITAPLETLDVAIENGFILSVNDHPTWEWRDLEILRLYDWGQVHFTWCTDKKNKDVESKIKKLAEAMDLIIEEYSNNIFSMTLNYSTDYK